MTQPATNSSSAIASNPPLRTRRVVYADDMKELRELVQVVLGREGFAVETFPDGKAALKRVASEPETFDLVITDHHMPEMNGLEFVHGLRALNFRGRIMVFSSELSFDVHIEYRTAGVDRILHKPIIPAQLRQILGEFFP